MIDFSLTDEQRALVDHLRRFLSEQIQPEVSAHDSAGTPLPNAFAKLVSAGVSGLPFPEKYGGAG